MLTLLLIGAIGTQIVPQYILAVLGLIGFVVLVISLIFDNDNDHDFGHDHDTGMSDTPGPFSTKVIAAFLMLFGATGFVLMYQGMKVLPACLYGLVAGLAGAIFAYLILLVIYKQQATSAVQVKTAIGQKGTVSTTIKEGKPGQIDVDIDGRHFNPIARSSDGKTIPVGTTIEVVDVVGTEFLVKPAQ